MTRSTLFDTVILREVQRFPDLEGAWWDLFGRAPRATPFQSPAWLLPWAECLGAERPVRIVVVSHGATLVGLLMLAVENEDGRRVARLFGHGVSDVLDALVDAGAGSAVLDGLSRALVELSNELDAIELTDLPEESALTQLTELGAAKTCCICPRVELDRSYDAYLGALPRWLERNVRQGEARLLRKGERSTLADPANYASALDAFFDLHAARWRSRGLPGVLTDASVRHFHRRAVPALLARGLLELATSFVENEPVASSYVLLRRDASLYLSGFHPAFARDSLGSVVIARSIARAIRAGRRHYDFLRGSEPYKYAWGAENRSTLQLTVSGRQNP